MPHAPPHFLPIMASLKKKKLSYNFVVKFVREKIFCAYSKNVQTITVFAPYFKYSTEIVLLYPLDTVNTKI